MKFINEYMTKSKFVIDKLARLFEQGLISYKDLSTEIFNILRSKRDEIVFKMKLTSKEETDILIKRLDNIEKKIEKIEKNSFKKKSIKGKKS
jgi:tetrahydromethanopterin S-methyltransferase subunit G|tara:strand:+ start:145 stop:420 length:276 start_codon:yes stop_codon:yes gene_type:complete